MRNTLFLAAATLSLSGAVHAQSSLAAPQLGYVLDQNIRALRPILGIPGAAVLGRPLELGFPIEAAAIDGQNDYALAIDRAQRKVWLIRFGDPAPVVPIPIVGRAEALYLSPQGTAAAVAMNDGRIEILNGISRGSLAFSELQVDAPPSALAVSDDGNYAIAVFGDGQPLLLGRDGRRIPIAVSDPVSVVAFQPLGADVIAAGPSNRVWLIEKTLTTPAIRPVAGPQNGVSGPSALAFTAGGSQIVTANSVDGTLSVIDLGTGTVSPIACGCLVNRFERLAMDGVFRLTDASNQPVYLFSAGSRNTVFVPPARESAPGVTPSRRIPQEGY